MEARRPAWWNTELPELAARREPMPAVERWQTTYVRYHRAGEAHVAQGGWSVQSSRRNVELLARAGQAPLLPEPDTPQAALFSASAPEAATMRIVEAPSAFALPVKQDRRFSPSFRVRVEVQFRHRVHLPLTVKAYVISQQEKDTILSWTPDELALEHEQRMKPVTELKGTASITHHFEACAQQPSLLPQQFSSGQHSAGSRPVYPVQSGGWGAPEPQDVSFVEQMLSIGKGNPVAGAYGMSAGGYMQQQMPQGGALYGVVNGAASGSDRISSSSGGGNFDSGLVDMKLEMDSSSLGGSGGGGGPVSSSGAASTAGLSAVAHEFDFESLEFLKPSRLNRVYLLFACSVMDLDTLFVVYNVPTVSICRAEQREKACVKLGLPPNAHAAVQRVLTTGMSSAAATMSQYDPTPATTPMSHQGGGVSGMSTPQVSMMHDQSSAAAAAAAAVAADEVDHMPMDALDTGALDTGALDVLFESPVGTPRPMQRKREHGPNSPELEDLLPPGWGVLPSMGSLGMHNQHSGMLGNGMLSNGMVGHNGMSLVDEHLALPRSRMALREWILEEYDSTGLSRKLTQQDLAALLSQAGFPADISSDHATISQGQWDEFSEQLRSVFVMVRQIAGVWDLEDPVVISGFDMDRLGTVQALRNEPAGTFICRFSMSQPGCLVLTCKVTPGHPRADADALLHAIIKVDDLQERRVDAWIRDFVGATHLLDVYRQRRVDKRKVFASNYTRLRGMPLTTPSEGLIDLNSGLPMGFDTAMAGGHWQS